MHDKYVLFSCLCLLQSLKDDDSGDHDQDQGSPKDGEKEKTEDEDKEQNTARKKASTLTNGLYAFAAS